MLYAWTSALLADMGGAESALPPLTELEGLKRGTDMATVSEALFDEWFAGVRAEHLAEGIKQGMERGMERGIERGMERGMERGIEQGMERGIERERARGLARLRRQAAIKFGAYTAERLAVLLGTAVANERMARLSDRVSDWVVECERGEDLLSRVSALVGNGDAES